MRKLNQDQRGFGSIEILLLVVIVGALGFTGWYVWHSKQQADSTYANTAKSARSSSLTTKKSTLVTPRASPTYLTIKEWGVKLPLDNDDKGAYYTISATSGLTQSVLIFDTSIDATANAKGVTCKDPTYPLLVISRIKPSDVAATQDINGPDYIGDTGPNSFQYFSFTKQYEFAAESPHQAAPKCEDIGNASGNFEADATVGAKYTAVDNALSTSFKNMIAQ